ncbi:MAG: histidine kinase [Aeromicrobium sp.]|uniref:sensor histidine kinase n=1 Tax=Aeromicrobium sp. TaxID=1871063 RepID=UPI0039E472C2
MSEQPRASRPPGSAAPPISRWGHIWRFSLVLLLSAAGWTEIAFWQWDHARWWFWLDLAVGMTTLILVVWRRRWPTSVAFVTNLLTAVSYTAGGPATLALFSLATRRRWRAIIPAGVVAVVAGVFSLRSSPLYAPGDLLVVAPVLIAIISITVAWGMYTGSRRELLATLRERAETAEAEQSARVAQARIGERTRIAREMHDVLAHRISTVTMHAGALAYRQDLPADQVRETAALIHANAHQALVELREVLGLLRDDPRDAAPDRPQPDAAAIAGLIEEARASGLRVSGDIAVNTSLVPPSVGRTAYRVVQEGLTNVRKHATHTAASVELRGMPGEELVVTVRNKMPLGRPGSDLPTSGLGLIGLRERVELAGGRLTREVTADRNFVLAVWLPWPA